MAEDRMPLREALRKGEEPGEDWLAHVVRAVARTLRAK